jgi:hypothetical protein
MLEPIFNLGTRRIRSGKNDAGRGDTVGTFLHRRAWLGDILMHAIFIHVLAKAAADI